jgi:hypothetical protein
MYSCILLYYFFLYTIKEKENKEEKATGANRKKAW